MSGVPSEALVNRTARLVFEEDGSRKFWEIEQADALITRRWGKIGARGQAKAERFGSATDASEFYDTEVAGKLKKGYREGQEEATAAPSSDGATITPPPAAKDAEGAGPKYVEQVLSLDGQLADAVEAWLDRSLGVHAPKKSTAAELRPELLTLVGSRIVATAPPAWISTKTWVIHLAPPFFAAEGHDGDEFFQDAQGLAKSQYYQTEGELVLFPLQFVEDEPKGVARKKLLRGADQAIHTELDQYDAAEQGAVTVAAPAPAPAPTAQGPSGCGDADAGRTGTYPTTGPKTAPQRLWIGEEETSGGEYGGSPVIAGDYVCTMGEATTPDVRGRAVWASVTALDGKSLWKKPLIAKQSWPKGDICVDRGVMYCPTSAGLFALDLATGNERWKASLSKISGSPVVAAGFICVPLEKEIVALDITTGRRKWKIALDSEPSGALAARGSMIYFRTGDKIRAVDAHQGGASVWEVECPGYVSLVVAGERVVTAGRDPASLVTFDAATGAEQARIPLEERPNYGSGLSVGGGIAVYLGEDGRVRAYDLASQKHLWTEGFTPVPYSIGRRKPSIADGVIYFPVVDRVLINQSGDLGRPLIACELETGKLLWQLDDLGECRTRTSGRLQPGWHSTLAIHEGVLFVQTYSGMLALK